MIQHTSPDHHPACNLPAAYHGQPGTPIPCQHVGPADADGFGTWHVLTDPSTGARVYPGATLVATVTVPRDPRVMTADGPTWPHDLPADHPQHPGPVSPARNGWNPQPGQVDRRGVLIRPRAHGATALAHGVRPHQPVRGVRLG